MRILVTGGSGFIGKHLLPILAGHEVRCLNRAPLAESLVIHGDLNVPESYADELARFSPECCIHLAWGGLPDYSFQNCRTNLSASTALFEVLGRCGCGRIIAAGSCWEYGALTGAVQETDQNGDLNLFAAHKAALQLIGRSYAKVSGIRFAWGRVFFTYGAGQRQLALIPSCYRSLKNGIAPQINNPQASNDFIHVADVASALCRLIEADDVGGIYNIGAGRPVAVWEVVNQIADEMGLAPVYHDMPSATEGLWADTTKMSALGWQPSISLKEGIARTLKMLEAEQ